MEISVRGVRHVIVDDDIDALNIDTTSENVSSNHDALVKFLEGLVLRNTTIQSDHIREYLSLQLQTVPLESCRNECKSTGNCILKAAYSIPRHG